MALLKEGWGEVTKRAMEQTEIIGRPGSDEEELRRKWDPFIHTHHYDVVGDFFDSWMAGHPRRTGEAYINQFWDAQFIGENPVPRDVATLEELVEWFQPLFDVERAHHDDPTVSV